MLVEDFTVSVEQLLGRQTLKQFKVFAERDATPGGAIRPGMSEGERQVSEGGGHGVGVASLLIDSA